MGKGETNWGAIGAIAGLAAVAIGLGAWLMPRESVPESISPEPTSTIAPSSDSPGAVPESSGEAAPGEDTSVDITSFAPVTLSTESAVEYPWCITQYGNKHPWVDDAGPIAGVPYLSALACEIASAGATGEVQFLVPPGATRFTVVAGQPDDASNTSITMRFEVFDVVSGHILAAHDLAFGQSAAIDTPVTGLVRVGMRVGVVSFGDSPDKHWGRASWAEPTFK